MGKFRQILAELSAQDTPIFSFPDDNLSISQCLSPNLVCALILWNSGLGLLMGKFYQFFTVICPRRPYFSFQTIT